MLKKLACIGLGVMIVITLSGCGKENKLNEYDKESNVNIINKAEIISENVIRKDEFIDKIKEIDRYGEDAYTQYDTLLNEIYNYLSENMNEEEFNKLKEDEVRWIKQKDKVANNSQDKQIAVDYTYERCYYLISLLDELKYIDMPRLKLGSIVNEMINKSTTSIVFDKYSENSYGFEWGKGRDVSANDDNSIQLFQRGNAVYVLGENIIYANPNSSNLFRSLSKLKEINLSNLDTKYVIDMSNMFYGCYQLSQVDVSNLDTNKVKDMSSMFLACNNLTNIDMSGLDTSNVKDMSGMFYNCNKLSQLDIKNLDTSQVKNMANMFDGCNSLTNVDMSGLNTSKVENMSNMFYRCNELVSIDLSNFNTSNVKTMRSMFADCSNLTDANLNNITTSKVEDMASMFHNCFKLSHVDLSNFNTNNVKTMRDMFANCSSLKRLDLSNFDTSKTIDMSKMFNECSSLEKLDISNFDTRNVTDMSYMFQKCSSLKNLNLSSFDTSKVVYMIHMFDSCSSLTTLDMSNFNAQEVKWMNGMFYNCSNLTSLQVNDFATNSLMYNTQDIFVGCDKLSDIEKNKILKIEIDKKDILWENMQSLDSKDYACWGDEFKNPFYEFEQIPGISLDVEEKILCDLDGDNIAEEIYLKVIDGAYDDYLPVKQLYINGILKRDNDTSKYYIADLNRNDNQLELVVLGMPGSFSAYDVLTYRNGEVKSEEFFHPQTDGYGHIIDSIDTQTGILAGYARVNIGDVTREKPKYKDAIYYSSEKLIFSENYDEIKKWVEWCYQADRKQAEEFFQYRNEHVVNEETSFKVIDVYGERHTAIPFVKLEDGREGYVMYYYADR